MNYKVYRFGPDYFLAENLRQAVREHCQEIGTMSRRECIEEAEVVSKEECDNFNYHDDIDDIYRDPDQWEGSHRSLTKQCEKVLKMGVKMPHYLCTTEY